MHIFLLFSQGPRYDLKKLEQILVRIFEHFKIGTPHLANLKKILCRLDVIFDKYQNFKKDSAA